MKITISKDMKELSFDEFKAFIEKVMPGEDAEKIWVDNGGVLPKEPKKTKKEE